MHPILPSKDADGLVKRFLSFVFSSQFSRWTQDNWYEPKSKRCYFQSNRTNAGISLWPVWWICAQHEVGVNSYKSWNWFFCTKRVVQISFKSPTKHITDYRTLTINFQGHSRHFFNPNDEGGKNLSRQMGLTDIDKGAGVFSPPIENSWYPPPPPTHHKGESWLREEGSIRSNISFHPTIPSRRGGHPF